MPYYNLLVYLFLGKIPTYTIIRTYVLYIYLFQGEIPNDKIILSSFELLFCCFMHFKVASKS